MRGIGREYAVEVHYELANRIDPEPGDTPEASVEARIGGGRDTDSSYWSPSSPLASFVPAGD
jgi:hypothetical protein